MHFTESINMSVKALTANKLRSTLTMLGIIIGNASVIAMVAIGQGAQRFTQQQLEAFGPNQLTIYAGAFDDQGLTNEAAELVLADVDAIAAQAPAVRAVAPQIGAHLRLSHQSRSKQADVTGTTPGILYVRNLQIRQGRFFSLMEQKQSAQVVILGPAIAQKLFGRDHPLGQFVQINSFNFQVIGVTQSKGALFGVNYDETAYVPIMTMVDQLSGRRSPNGIPIDYLEISAQDQASIRAAAFQITNILTRRHGQQDFTVFANKSFQDLIAQVTGAMSLLLAAIAGISLLVGGIGVMNIMLVSVTERTHEIGLRKAIGATQKAILAQFLIEAVILSVTGGLIGIGIGVGGATIVAVFTPLQPGVPVSAIALATGVSGSIGLIFGVVPARQAARLDPIAALRSA